MSETFSTPSLNYSAFFASLKFAASLLRQQRERKPTPQSRARQSPVVWSSSWLVLSHHYRMGTTAPSGNTRSFQTSARTGSPPKPNACAANGCGMRPGSPSANFPYAVIRGFGRYRWRIDEPFGAVKPRGFSEGATARAMIVRRLDHLEFHTAVEWCSSRYSTRKWNSF